MQIASISLKNNLFVAPMAGVTDLPYRRLCRAFGAGLAVSEMITANTQLYASTKTRRRSDHRGEPGPISVQIAGADPQQMAQAARHNVANGAQIIDINMGCPAKKVCNVAAGSALMRDEALVARILEAVVEAVPEVPVTLKCRTGWDREHRNVLRVAHIAEAAGIQAIAVHGRTRADLYMGEAEYEHIAAVKQAVKIPVIANGDIDSPRKAARILQATGADGVMIGRAAQGRPWLFREIAHFLATGEEMLPPTLAEALATARNHLQELHAFYGELAGVRVARKHLAWYARGLVGAHAFRQQINQIETAAAQLQALEHYFAGLGAPDERLTPASVNPHSDMESLAA
ncbi:MAG: tRNA dihydrouridine synthase DusB [Candidatus Dactylopiibacterium carminicum]|uniref:tRNA-dihydrouridine synthase B n=1 Tax=Candidatus Dactylopiibacterium carminicum TaxID=857335 RepID=A0A272EVA0_9RHOO|nr:tRNA dihydrouridine synthase DusB [Candidatus Dactylopiibacterium carminicum]KAF7600138.1 tRNA dihydrouridine synthase DusB [Candidatus Dactylopiibacterium carminicum]PAS94033.1 MAG: tRNA dihydrouridine synthase DusB [Candidatus Dactylopiibacterium carminicum]PAS98204.1 MAG: tRNA dihydrouridine synthase DusB [Candidatus Dactylopiibacterium carminicum]PAT00137.1 MAG: tRNA dihydrouridine synthase DusB [Candidatus Dactylopiibacterium carminicum]